MSDLRGSVRRVHVATIRTGDLGGRMGAWDPASATIWLDHGLTIREQLATLVHEFAHVQRGDGPCEGHYAARVEGAVEQITAETLVDLRALAVALRWSQDVHEVAEELGVEPAVVRARLAGLSDADRAWLSDRVWRASA